jgi:hypothetical protein
MFGVPVEIRTSHLPDAFRNFSTWVELFFKANLDTDGTLYSSLSEFLHIRHTEGEIHQKRNSWKSCMNQGARGSVVG